jgi:hypothetical protein
MRRPLASDLKWRCDSIRAHDLAGRSNEVRRNEGHVSYPASDIKDPHAGTNTRLDKQASGDRLYQSSLGTEAFEFSF